jgi:uncharacterized radical SAM superfamily Fe-S cluster-containing enzyme
MKKIFEQDVSDVFLCDLCNEDYSQSEEQGGFLFMSKAVCPKCAERMEATIKKHKEERYIRDKCKEGETFKDFIKRHRSVNPKIIMYVEDEKKR